MEGRALDRVARQGWAWFLPACGIGFGQGGQALFDAERVPYVLAGAVMGAAWQLLYRRDLVARLTWPALMACLVVGTTLVSREEFERSDETMTAESAVLYFVALLAALVLTEQFLRWQDRRVSAEAAPATTPGTASR